MKRCDQCKHSMECEADKQVFCIYNPPVVLGIQDALHGFRTVCAFPQMMKWGKCDRFAPGVTQKQNKAD